ncbi:phage tail family protein [Bacillus sp. ISL-45]|uniref:phage tail family protein n=1 Tax=Bacillus sp. ISL-45 TaxID=2819128 RepID=UPI001BE731AC|nr:phage tail family protein [Bacillus sp. ISL-45]MBT2661951.1 phage tail family protein [Bacillus sp. ISL-45]
MERIIYTSSNGEIIRFDGPPFYLSRISGLGEVDAELQLQKSPYQDGSSLMGSVLQEREVTVEFLIEQQAYSEVSDSRAKIARAFNPKLKPGIIRYENDFVVREIEAIADSVPIYPDGHSNRSMTLQKGMITLTCPNPYWKSEDQVEQLAVFESGLTFPVTFPTAFAQQSPSKSKLIMNEGDVDTPIEVTFTGPATAPIIIRNETTGKMIEVNQSLLDGEKLVINTEFGKKRVTKVSTTGIETNAFNQINISTSELFQLIAGNNLLSYSTGQDYERAPVIIKWKNRYLAV